MDILIWREEKKQELNDLSLGIADVASMILYVHTRTHFVHCIDADLCASVCDEQVSRKRSYTI